MDSEYHQSRTLLVFEGQDCNLAFDAMQVRSMRPAEEWHGQEPMELDAHLQVSNDPEGKKAHRVIVLETDDDEEVPVSVRGPVSIETVPGDSVTPPAPESERELTDFLSGVVQSGTTRTLVLAPGSIRGLRAAS